MNLNEKFEELIKLTKKYLARQVEPAALSQFAWEVITFFSSTARENMPSEQGFEPEFWYAVWQIQHLAGESDDSLMRSQISKTLEYLEGRQILPRECAGSRP